MGWTSRALLWVCVCFLDCTFSDSSIAPKPLSLRWWYNTNSHTHTHPKVFFKAKYKTKNTYSDSGNLLVNQAYMMARTLWWPMQLLNVDDDDDCVMMMRSKCFCGVAFTAGCGMRESSRGIHASRHRHGNNACRLAMPRMPPSNRNVCCVDLVVTFAVFLIVWLCFVGQSNNDPLYISNGIGWWRLMVSWLRSEAVSDTTIAALSGGD